ncbi:sugar ABC transporter substrate-binding protein [Mycolicibacterium sp. P9-22]|uniref:sugar ABC transporter substrate-binding protein n=1 Tax=Mycolicibacterium sp. P9-22 TaxID=2024613 RepID=UPI0011EF8189|nr:sugar ABC transporter substrate-binding protein [Mycolicibacterium sp. P9-22]KAA0114675.1 sugar ABC transporter substrate-binding protein [Mycolicibacterium sp. P9-22]
MRKSRTTAALVGVSVGVMSLVGCSSGSGGESGVTIGYSTYTLSNPFFAGMLKGFQDGAEEHGYELVTANANGDPAQQVTDIQNLISRGVDYVLLTPADGKAIAPAIAAADAAGIPVISVPDRVDSPIAVTIAMDEVDTGKQAGNYIVDEITKKNGEPEGNIVQIEGITGIPSAMARKEGFRSVIGQHPGLKIVASQDGGYDTDQSFKVMVDILQANPKIDAIFATNDAEAIGVTAALKSQGRFFPVGHPEHVVLLGADGSKPAIEDIRNKVQDATLSLNPIKSADKAVDIVAALEAGDPVESEIIWPTMLITTDNINSQEVAEYGIWSDEL